MTEDRETMTEADDTKVICPNCTHQFRAISIADQARLAQSNAEAVCPRCGGRGPHMHPKTPWEGRLDFDTPDNNFERHLQPVAWRYAYPGYPGHWNVTSDKLTVDERQGNAGCIIEPLYTTTPRPDASTGLIEAAEPVAWEYKTADGWERISLGNYKNLECSSFELRPVYNTAPPCPDASAGLIAALNAVFSWARQRCPCENDMPAICPLCDADVTKDTCKAVPGTFPPRLLKQMQDALRAADRSGK